MTRMNDEGNQTRIKKILRRKSGVSIQVVKPFGAMKHGNAILRKRIMLEKVKSLIRLRNQLPITWKKVLNH